MMTQLSFWKYSITNSLLSKYIIITYISYTNNQIGGTVEIITIADDAGVGETGVLWEKPTMEAEKN